MQMGELIGVKTTILANLIFREDCPSLELNRVSWVWESIRLEGLSIGIVWAQGDINKTKSLGLALYRFLESKILWEGSDFPGYEKNRRYPDTRI